MPNIKAMEEYNLTHREKRVILDEVKGLKVCIVKLMVHKQSVLKCIINHQLKYYERNLRMIPQHIY